MDPNSISITFWQFHKKKNSTALPSAQGTVLSCSIKDLCTETRPVIRLRLSPNYPQFNYCYIQSFLRYYWIDEWTYNEGIWEAACTVDPLASFRAQIMASEKYVTRCADADYYDLSLPDEYYTTHGGASCSSHSVPASPWSTSGCFILGVIGKGNVGTIPTAYMGSVSYYAFLPSEMRTLLNYLFGNGLINQLIGEDITENYVRVNYNPFKYIASCQWLPNTTPASGTEVNTIPFGYTDLAVTAHVCSSNITGVTQTITIPRHSQAATRGSYLNLEPWSRYVLKYPPFCNASLDSSILYGETSISVQQKIDIATGIGRLNVKTGSGKFIADFESQIGVPVQLADISRNNAGIIAGIAGAAVNAAVGAATGNVGAIFDTSNIGNALKAANPTLQTSGSNGSRIVYNEIPTLYNYAISLVPENLADKGRPCCKVLELSDLSGYVECADGHIAATLLADEYDMLETYMTGGFYLE